MQAAVSLARRILGLVGLVDLGELSRTRPHLFLLGVLATHIDKLEIVAQTVCHDLAPLDWRVRYADDPLIAAVAASYSG
jgi:hypothetical protein